MPVVHPRHVRQQHQRVRLHQRRRVRRQVVVVPDPDLPHAHRVVLVHNRHHPRLEQRAQRRPRVQVPATVRQPVLRQQHLPHLQPVHREQLCIHTHEPRLTHRRRRLTLPQRHRRRRHPQPPVPRRHRSARHQHHLHLPMPCHSLHVHRHPVPVQLQTPTRQQPTAQLHHQPPGRRAPQCGHAPAPVDGNLCNEGDKDIRNGEEFKGGGLTVELPASLPRPRDGETAGH